MIVRKHLEVACADVPASQQKVDSTCEVIKGQGGVLFNLFSPDEPVELRKQRGEVKFEPKKNREQ